MTVQEWLHTRTPVPPGPLLDRVVEHLGADAAIDAALAGEACSRAGVKLVGQLVGEQRDDRQNALDLLAADALVTYAIEHAAEHAREPAPVMEALVARLSAIVDGTPA